MKIHKSYHLKLISQYFIQTHIIPHQGILSFGYPSKFILTFMRIIDAIESDQISIKFEGTYDTIVMFNLIYHTLDGHTVYSNFLIVKV